MKKIIFPLCLIIFCGLTLNATSAKVIDKVKGKILLQVENHGEAWYVNPMNNKKYYLGKPSDAFQIMKQQGVGITEKNLNKIPIAGKPVSGGNDVTFTNQHLGKIFLQVEKNGEAWYVNPSDAKRYFLGRPSDAFNLMKSLGLGITNNNVNQIPTGGTLLPPKPEKPYVAPPIYTPVPPPTPNTSKSIGCAFNNPPCAPGFECQSNQCVKKIGCLYQNPACGAGYDCSNNKCVKKSGCAYENPKCGTYFDCVDNACVKQKGCANNNPACKWNEQCKNNVCISKIGCNYDNPMCGANETCLSNVCKKKTGCDYNNPACANGYDCLDNKCVKKIGCLYDNPKCASGYNCVNNQCVKQDACIDVGCQIDETCSNGKCVKRQGCMFGNVSCGSNSQCVNNVCKLKTDIALANAEPQNGYCCFDHELKTGAFEKSPCLDDADTENIPATSIEFCRQKTFAKGYRYSTYYKSTNDFALICTEPCAMDDAAFVEANDEGIKIGINALKNATGGVMPKGKIEFHLDKDGDCNYNQYHSGSSGTENGHPQICNAEYYWYLASQGTKLAGIYTLDSYKTIARQTLTIHEPIHNIFESYKAASEPAYAIQESFCKAVSLREVGTISSYDSKFLAGNFSIDNPPPSSSVDNINFFVYSLAIRYGFGPSHAKTFFQAYELDTDKKVSGNQKVKAILDSIMGVDTLASFKDIGIINVK